MSKLFGYTQKGGQNWFKSDAYSDKEIESIKDPEGGSEVSLPTAIPSPFARMDLVKTAFNNIAKTPDLRSYSKDGKVIAGENDEQLVSDTLDLAEILFNYDSIKDKIKIIVWDKDSEIKALKQSSYNGHRQLAETLELYLDQDKASYNFDLLKRLYLLEYNYKIIGCTSPATLFFPTANDLKHAQINLTKNDVTFDDKYCPLYERDADFQKYIHLLFIANPILAQRLGVISEYLEKSLKILDQKNHALFQEIKNLNATDFYSNYTELDTGIAGNIIEIIGVSLRKRKKEDILLAVQSSDFIINSHKYQGELKPLVLQNNFNKTLRYVNDIWDNSINIPYLETQTSIEKRILPGKNIQYPFVTVSDFLEPYLIRLVYPINKEKYFNGNIIIDNGDNSKGYLLPIKREFFDYFDSIDLLNSSAGKPKIEMIQGAAGSVKVILRIPIVKEGEFITFERIYYQISDKPNEEQNKGVIVEHQFGITLFPFIKNTNSHLEPFYRVQLIDRDVIGEHKSADFDLNFYTNTTSDTIEVRAKKTRSIKKPDASDTATSQYYVLANNFDFIQVKNSVVSGASGIIIPKWEPSFEGNEVFSFSIDFGTTNTHIEYKVGNSGNPKPFDITKEDLQIATLFHPTETTEDFGGSGAIAIRELIDHEFIPQLLGNDSEYKFPHRTVLAESHNLNVDTQTFSLADFNIPFIYERKPEKDKIQSNLKWAKKEKGNEKRVTAYFEKIMMLLRNKVILNKGNLAQTKIIWFYPSSMKPARKSQLEETWNSLFQTYFKPNQLAIGVPESLAPYYYFKGINKLQGSYKPVVSIDIGGGTSDVVVFKSNKPLLLTSFKFAANSIFGDGFSEYGAATSNGIISKYYPFYENLLATNKLYDLSKVLSTIKDKNRTEDINAFFFSIENNPKIKDKKLFSYNALLANDEDLKIVFLYFYTAIIYHIASLMKQEELELPKHIVFSGTGSKILNIITSDAKILANYSKKIFELVYNQTFDMDGLSVESEKDIPKEVTCKGGLMLTEDMSIDIQSLKATYTCIDGLEKLTYDCLDDTNKAKIAKYVNEFNAFFMELNSMYSFADYFNASQKSIELFKTELNKHVRDYLEDGLEYNRKLDEIATDDKELEETLFFYPVIGAINYLSNQLAHLTPINN
jgi:hypothetical protein